MTEKLKRCPFCNGQATVLGTDGVFWVGCGDCHAVMQFFITKEEAVAAWNNRPAYDQMEKENKRLFDALDEIVNRNEFSRYCDISRLDDAIYDYNIQIDGIPLIRIAQRALEEVKKT